MPIEEIEKSILWFVIIGDVKINNKDKVDQRTIQMLESIFRHIVKMSRTEIKRWCMNAKELRSLIDGTHLLTMVE